MVTGEQTRRGRSHPPAHCRTRAESAQPARYRLRHRDRRAGRARCRGDSGRAVRRHHGHPQRQAHRHSRRDASSSRCCWTRSSSGTRRARASPRHGRKRPSMSPTSRPTIVSRSIGQDALAETPIRSIMAFQLFIAGETMGALNVYAEQPNVFGRSRGTSGLVFAAHSSVAWNSARREEQFKKRLGQPRHHRPGQGHDHGTLRRRCGAGV